MLVTPVSVLVVVLVLLFPVVGKGPLLVLPEELVGDSVLASVVSGDKGNDSEHYGQNILVLALV